jgi:hypothetical protein
MGYGDGAEREREREGVVIMKRFRSIMVHDILHSERRPRHVFICTIRGATKIIKI